MSLQTIAALTGKAAQVAALTGAPIDIYEGSVRSAKTVTSCLDWLAFVLGAPPGELAIIGRTERTVERNVISVLAKMVGPQACRYNKGTGTLMLLGRVVSIIGANNEAAVSKIQGATLAGIYIDEVATLPEVVFNMARTRTSVPGARIIATCNPEGRQHWLKVRWLDRAMLWVQKDGTVVLAPEYAAVGLNRFTFILDDNPHLPADFVASLRASYTGVWYRRYIESEWTNAEGAIYDQWDPALHVVSELPPIVRVHGTGIDYGTTNPTVAVTLGEGSDGVLYAMDEWRHQTTEGRAAWTDAQLANGLIDWIGERDAGWLIVDPSAASFRAQLWVMGRSKVMSANNAVLDGIRTTSSLLATGKLKVHTSCTALIEELPEYAWDPKATAAGKDSPIKLDDHSCDALRYAVHSTRQQWKHLNTEEPGRAAA